MSITLRPGSGSVWSMPIAALSLISMLVRSVAARLCIAALTIIGAYALSSSVSFAQADDEEISSEVDVDDDAEPAPIIKKIVKRRAAGDTSVAKPLTKRRYAKSAAKARTKLVTKPAAAKAKRRYAAKSKLAKARYAAKPTSSKTRYASAKKRAAPTRTARRGGKQYHKQYQKIASRPGGVRGNLAGCIPGQLRSVLAEIARAFGAVSVSSSYRSPAHNRAVGGAKRSWHMRCQAVDFRVAGNGRAVLNFIRSHPKVGGYKRYPAGFFHIDTGPRRTW